MKCFQCAVEIVELTGHEPPYVVEVLPGGPGGAGGACRATVLCPECMRILKPDMWLSEEGWDVGKPAVPFATLPIYNHDLPTADDPNTYADVLVPS